MTLVMLAGAGSFLMIRPYFAEKLTELLSLGLMLDRGVTSDPNWLPLMLGAGFSKGFELLAPLLVILVVAALVGVLSFGGWAFSLESLTPKLEKLNPLTGLKRVFGWSGLSELAKAMGKFVLVAVIGGVLLSALAGDLLGLGRLAVQTGMAKASWIVAVSFMGLSSALILIAAADVPFQAWQHKRKLRMTKQELKEEHKETEGKPELRSRIRAAQQEIAGRRMLEEVATADVVATNPTHFAVALRYDPDNMRAPKVVAKGADLIALNIRRIAEANGVPLFEHPPLAQALFHTTSLGEEIPPRLYVAVAQVLTYVFQLKRHGRGASKAEKPNVDIDPELLEEPQIARRLARQRVDA